MSPEVPVGGTSSDDFLGDSMASVADAVLTGGPVSTPVFRVGLAGNRDGLEDCRSFGNLNLDRTCGGFDDAEAAKLMGG